VLENDLVSVRDDLADAAGHEADTVFQNLDLLRDAERMEVAPSIVSNGGSL
jgi:hypothetical protein